MNLEKEIFDISLQDIIPNRFQPREMFDDEALQELSQSIKEHGVIQPIIVRKVGDKYEIIAGERRFRASQLAGKETIPALIRDIDDKEAAKIALLENLQRSNLTPIEEAKTYQTILKLDNITQEELAQNLGKSQSTIANKLRLLTLDEEVQTALLNSQISERHARSLIGLDHSRQKELLHKVINEKLTVRQLDEEIISNATGQTLGNNQIQMPRPQNLSEGRIPMDMNQNPVVQNPIFASPISENNEQARETNLKSNIIKEQINSENSVEIPQMNQVNQNINELNIPNTNNIESQETFNNENHQNNMVQDSSPQLDPVMPNKEPELPKNNIFDKLRVQNVEQTQQPDPVMPNKEPKLPNLETQNTQSVSNIEQAPSIINQPTVVQSEKQPETQNFNNIYDLRFAINNFRQAIQNTEKFGFKIKAEEYDSEDKYQIVIEIEKKD